MQATVRPTPILTPVARSQARPPRRRRTPGETRGPPHETGKPSLLIPRFTVRFRTRAPRFRRELPRLADRRGLDLVCGPALPRVEHGGRDHPAPAGSGT